MQQDLELCLQSNDNKIIIIIFRGELFDVYDNKKSKFFENILFRFLK